MAGINNVFGLIVVFVIIGFLIMFSIGGMSAVPVPNQTSSPDAYNQYKNLTKTTDLGYTGMNAVQLLIMGAMLLASILLIAEVAGKRR